MMAAAKERSMAQQQTLASGHPDTAAAGSAAIPEEHRKTTFWTLAIGAVGVVYGDIGTSPLYAMRETVAAASGGHGAPISREAVLGILSLLWWSLVLTVSVKYVFLLLEADNNGEGGSLTLVTLAQRASGDAACRCWSWAWRAPLSSTAMRRSRRRYRSSRRSRASNS
jgi:KUP system potassium uptake protein